MYVKIRDKTVNQRI